MKTSSSHTATLKSIEKQIHQGQLQEAANALTQLAKAGGQDPRLFLLGSLLAEASRNPDGMLYAARKAHQLAPQWPAATIHLAGVLASRDEGGIVAEAMGLATLAIEQAQVHATQDVELLNKAALIAQRLGQYDQALTWLRDAEKIDPADNSTRYKIGLALSAAGDFTGSIEILTQLLIQLPDSQPVLSARMQANLHSRNFTSAIKDGETLLALDPANEQYQFYTAIARGETPKTQPASRIADLFSDNASKFDEHLVAQLKYKLPREVAQWIHQWHPDRQGDILDLGCGTGLLGACLGPIEGVLVGVDLSEKMLAQASLHHVYDKFHQVNILDALQATPDSLYHVIAALDVLIYVGNLEIVVPNAHRILLPGGRFVFSCETGVDGEADYVLQSTLRYTHQRNYVQRLLEDADFIEIEIKEDVLRYEAGQPVQGFLVTARKQTPLAGKTARRSPKSAKPASLAQ